MGLLFFVFLFLFIIFVFCFWYRSFKDAEYLFLIMLFQMCCWLGIVKFAVSIFFLFDKAFISNSILSTFSPSMLLNKLKIDFLFSEYKDCTNNFSF